MPRSQKQYKVHRRERSATDSAILCGPPAHWTDELKSVGPSAKTPANPCGRCERSLAARAAKSEPKRSK